jgi:hypothetical protein
VQPVEEKPMSEHTFDAFARQTATVTRRGSLVGLGGAMLAAGIADPVGTEAKDNNDKKKKQKAKKKIKKRCNQQQDDCVASLLRVGGESALITFCCENCFSDDFLACVIANTPDENDN